MGTTFQILGCKQIEKLVHYFNNVKSFDDEEIS
jgi:hypothetical protein